MILSRPGEKRTVMISERNNRSGSGVGEKSCFWCKKKGNFLAECRAFKAFKQRENARNSEGTRLEPMAGSSSSFVQGMTDGDPQKNAVYLELQLITKKVCALLDTECEHSIIGRRLILSAILRATNQCLYAANGTLIPLLGQVDMTFRVEAGRIVTTILVSDVIKELILGVDWLTAHNCRWDFGGQFIEVDGCVEELQTRPSGGILRRIYATEEIKIAAGQQMQVPVRATWPGLYANVGTWAVRPNALNETASLILDRRDQLT